MSHPLVLTSKPLSGAEQLELARQTIANAEKAERTATFMAWFLPSLLGILPLTVAILYFIQHRKNRHDPPIERKGANLLGGAYGSGTVGGKPTGAGGMGGVPGVSIPVNKPHNAPAEDLRKR